MDNGMQHRKVKLILEPVPKYRLRVVIHPHDVGIPSNRTLSASSECVPAPCTHRNKCAKQFTKQAGENPAINDILDVAKMAGVMVTETLKGLRQNPASYPARDEKERMTPITGRWWVEILDKLFTWMDETVL